jgi:hypothetical protein
MAIVGLMIGLALLMVASLLSMALWVHKRGRFRTCGECDAAVALSDCVRPGRMVPPAP